jgi:hypothetical protein
MTLEKFMSLSPEQEAKLPEELWHKMMGELNAREGATS